VPELQSDVAILHSRGKKVCLSIGGQTPGGMRHMVVTNCVHARWHDGYGPTGQHRHAAQDRLDQSDFGGRQWPPDQLLLGRGSRGGVVFC